MSKTPRRVADVLETLEQAARTGEGRVETWMDPDALAWIAEAARSRLGAPAPSAPIAEARRLAASFATSQPAAETLAALADRCEALEQANAWRPASEPPEAEGPDDPCSRETLCLLPSGLRRVGYFDHTPGFGWMGLDEEPTHWRELPEGPA